jgi:hypothetical protein
MEVAVTLIADDYFEIDGRFNSNQMYTRENLRKQYESVGSPFLPLNQPLRGVCAGRDGGGRGGCRPLHHAGPHFSPAWRALLHAARAVVADPPPPHTHTHNHTTHPTPEESEASAASLGPAPRGGLHWSTQAAHQAAPVCTSGFLETALLPQATLGVSTSALGVL